MPPKITTEVRFREGTGERYVSSGEVRCQGQSKNKLRRWRESHNDWETPSEDIWPTCQCEKPAVPGMFACMYHGGMTPSKDKPKSIFDVMPVDLGDKLRTLMEHPDYISNREAINVMQARQWELLETIKEGYGTAEAWGMVADALYQLKQGKLVEAETQLEEALETPANEKEVWQEYRQVQKIIDTMKSTEVKSAKELKLMATADQVAGLLNHMYNVINKGVEKYVSLQYINGYTEKRAQADFLNYVAGEIFKSANISPVTLNMLTDGD